MSLLKWKEMDEKRSELGKQINEVRQEIKKQSISDQVGEVEAAKLFKPITSGLRELAVPKPPLRRITKKKGPVPDYGIAVDDEVPDYGLEDLFGQQILPQDEKQIVPKPPTYKDVLDEIASGEKKNISTQIISMILLFPLYMKKDTRILHLHMKKKGLIMPFLKRIE